jgi:acetyltransferase-like isoleucine patch superfamily enzyme/acyl carrier protein
VLRSQLAKLRLELEGRLRVRACDAIGADARVHGDVRIVNEGRITIGGRFRLSGEPVASHLWAQNGGVIEIGDDVSVGHGSGITARGLIRIGSGTRLGAFVLAMDTDYHVAGDTTAAADIVPLEIGRGVSIGNHVTLLRGSLIGDGARVLDGSVVRGVVAAGEIVAGVPARAARSVAQVDPNGGIEARVRQLAQATFRLAELPALDDGPNQIPAWDSLGALSFLLALEEEFEIVLSEERLSGVGCLADAAAVVASASV